MDPVKKCVHGVYLACPEQVRTERARYCSLCTDTVDSDVVNRNWSTTKPCVMKGGA